MVSSRRFGSRLGGLCRGLLSLTGGVWGCNGGRGRLLGRSGTRFIIGSPGGGWFG